MNIQQMNSLVGAPQPTQSSGGMTVQQMNQLMGTARATPDQSAAALGNSNGMLQQFLAGADRFIQPEIGFVKNVAHDVLNTGGLIQEGIDQTLGRGINAIQGKGFTPTEGAATTMANVQSPYLNPTNPLQQAGGLVANIAEFVGPGASGKIGEAEGLVNKAAEYLPSFLRGVGRVGGKAAIEAIQAGATTYAQTGDPTKAMESALTFGALKGATGTVGETARAFNVPERLYETIFSKTAEDFKSQWNGKAAAAMEQSNPALYKQLVDQGIISTDKGVVKVNDSVALQALKKGLSGSGDKMGTVLTGQMMQSESKAQTLAGNFTGTVAIPKFESTVDVLRKTAADFAGVADGKYTELANSLADKLESGGGKLNGKDALQLRRFLDSMRTESTYDKPLVQVRALGQRNFKFQSDKVRMALNSTIPGMKDTMQDYAFQIRALDDISSHMTKAGHAALMNVWDTMIFDVGLSGGVPGVGGAMAITRRALGTAGGATGLAQGIEQGTQTGLGATLKGALGGLSSWMQNPTGSNSENTPPPGQ